MAAPKNRQQFVELEYCLDKYFNNTFAPIIQSESERFRRNAEHETRNRNDGGWGGYIDAANPFTTTRVQQTSGEWNRKNTEDLLATCNERFLKDPKVQEDINKMTIATRSALVSELGVNRYKELSKGVPEGFDLASFYVYNRFQQLFVEKMAQMKAPRNSFEFIMQKGLGDSLPGLMAGMQMKHSELDEQVKSLSEKFYGANVAEKTTAFGLSFILDSTVTGGYGSASSAAKWFAVDGGLRLGTSFLSQEKSFDELLSEEVWGDKNTVDNMRRDGKKVDPQKSEDIKTLNGMLNKQLYRGKYDEKEAVALCNKMKSSISVDNGAGLVRGIEAGYKEHGLFVKKDSAIPGWMKEKTDADLHHGACYWSAMAMEMQSKGIQKIVVAKKTYTLEQITQKGYDYARALSEAQRKRGIDAERSANGIETSNRPQIGQSSYVAQSVHSTTQQTQLQAGQQQQGVLLPNSQVQTSQQIAGWGGMLDQLGLGGFGEVGKNLGYVLAMLPDMLIGMFTGKSRNLKFGDNLLPIGAILMGMFTKNPLLKMLLVGLGGANLLNKAGQEILENRDGIKAKPVRQYRDYGDELLDSRIKDPAMKGNTLIATIDGVPSVITINSADAVDAYYKGKLPLNTLANAVLRKYDEQQQVVQENFNRQVVEDQSLQQSRGLK